MKFREITTCAKLQVPKITYGYQIRKSSISKINVAYSNTNPFHYIMNSDIIETQTYS